MQVLCVLLCTHAAYADVIEFHNGGEVQCTVISQTIDSVTVECDRPGAGTSTFPTSDIRAIILQGQRRVLYPEYARERAVGEPVRRGPRKGFTGLTPQTYQERFEELTPRGYRPVDIRGYVEAEESRYDLTLQKLKAGPWMARHNCTHEKFLEANRRARQQGMTLTVHSQFRAGGKVIHAAVWETLPVRFHESSEIPCTGYMTSELAPVDNGLTRFLRRHDIPGASVAIARDGRLLYARGFGYADLEKKRAVQPDSLFRIASVSKPLTAVAVLSLVDEGTLKLDQRAVDILKAYRPSGEAVDPRLEEVTVEHLLLHTAGWDSKKSGDPMFAPVRIARKLDTPPPADPEKIVRYMCGRPLEFDPGSRHVYSNFGYCVLGRIIEEVSHQSYESYVRTILAPLGITRMKIGRSRLSDRAEKEVRYYDRYARRRSSVFHPDSEEKVPEQYGGWCLESMDAHGGWIASATDLVRFASSLGDFAETRVLTRESVRKMFAPPPPPIARGPDGKLKPVYYGYGWSVRPKSHGKNTWHNGAFTGTSAILVRRHDGFCWAVLFNTRSSIRGGSAAGLVDGAMHRLVDEVRSWPEGKPLLR